MSTGSSNMIKLFKSWNGLTEKNGVQSKIIKPYNKLTGRALNCKTTPWCQIAVVSCIYQSKAVKKGKYSTTSGCLQAQSWYRKKKRLKKRGVTPSLAWQVFYDFKGKGKPTHTGIIIAINKKKKTITVVEGNKKNAVGYRTISWSSKYILSYGIPYYV